MFTRRAISALFVSSVLLATLVAPTAPVHAQQQQDDAAHVGVDAVIREDASQTVPVIGRLVARNAGVVSALVQGVVTEMAVDVGDRVEAGDILAVLSPDSLKWSRELRAAEVHSAQANVANARAQAKLRAQELKRLENLRKSSAFSPARLEDAQQELAKATSDAARAEADLVRAQANLELADIDLANAHVKAPYAGVVSATHTSVGTYLTKGQPVATLVDDQSLEIEADVPADRVEGLTPGTPVGVTIGRAETVAQVRAQVPEENPLTRTRKVRFTLPAGMFSAGAGVGAGAAANQSVAIAIPAGPKREVVSVHKDAVINKGGRRTVFIVENGKASVRPVQLGEAVGGRFIVLDGLQPGDQVVVRGNERLAPGQSVLPQPFAQ